KPIDSGRTGKIETTSKEFIAGWKEKLRKVCEEISRNEKNRDVLISKAGDIVSSIIKEAEKLYKESGTDAVLSETGVNAIFKEEGISADTRAAIISQKRKPVSPKNSAQADAVKIVADSLKKLLRLKNGTNVKIKKDSRIKAQELEDLILGNFTFLRGASNKSPVAVMAILVETLEVRKELVKFWREELKELKKQIRKTESKTPCNKNTKKQVAELLLELEERKVDIEYLIKVFFTSPSDFDKYLREQYKEVGKATSINNASAEVLYKMMEEVGGGNRKIKYEHAKNLVFSS
ncbi:MAG: hypothetical protein FWF97_03530, partial [Alphaproteobacteria bacterium]|nr:hypothetical protein [Alphaproteobacteria bacterium]